MLDTVKQKCAQIFHGDIWMIELEDAYMVMKSLSEEPIIDILETQEYFVGISDRYVTINKETGEANQHWGFVEIISIFENVKEIYLDAVFSDYMAAYMNDANEQKLSNLYAGAWNWLYHHRSEEPDGHRSESDTDITKLLASWSDIEKKLYTKIENIINNDDTIVNPPCVIEKYDDPFYRIKPFMVRNGWTVSPNTKTWERA